jgi:hypothetical protein
MVFGDHFLEVRPIFAAFCPFRALRNLNSSEISSRNFRFATPTTDPGTFPAAPLAIAAFPEEICSFRRVLELTYVVLAAEKSENISAVEDKKSKTEMNIPKSAAISHPQKNSGFLVSFWENRILNFIRSDRPRS